MKINNINIKCKNGHGITNHAVYQYGNSVTMRCLECEKEYKRKRMGDPEKYAHDKEYTKKWADKNRVHLREIGKKNAQRVKEERDAEVTKFLYSKGVLEKIQNYLNTLQCDYTLNYIKKHCYRRHITSWLPIKQYIRSRKLSELKRVEIYRESTLAKYHYGVRETWSDLPEEIKVKIRKEYRSKGNKKAEEKLRQLELNYK